MDTALALPLPTCEDWRRSTPCLCLCGRERDHLLLLLSVGGKGELIFLNVPHI